MSNELIDLLIQHPTESLSTKILTLLGGGCDINFANTSGMTPLKAAVMTCDAEIVELLLLQGAAATQETLDFCREKYPHKKDIAIVLHHAVMQSTLGAPTKTAASGVKKTKI